MIYWHLIYFWVKCVSCAYASKKKMFTKINRRFGNAHFVRDYIDHFSVVHCTSLCLWLVHSLHVHELDACLDVCSIFQ